MEMKDGSGAGCENIELVSELTDDLGLVKIDLAQAQQIILNLVLNARDAMPDGGRVTLSTRNCDGPIMERDARNQFCDSWVSFAVCDTGCGMDAETRSRLFEPFFTTKKPGKGNGLGLATVHRIVTHEGGRIEVESEAGRGTRVVVHLPRVEAKSLPECFRSWGQDQSRSESENSRTEESERKR
jgi:signal transduction histidine kinase